MTGITIFYFTGLIAGEIKNIDLRRLKGEGGGAVVPLFETTLKNAGTHPKNHKCKGQKLRYFF